MNFLLDAEQTERLLFRPIHETDYQDWLTFHQEPLSSQYWKTTSSNPKEACQQQCKAIFERYAKGLGGMNALICNKTNSFIGMCGLLTQEVDEIKEMEIGYSMVPKFWGKGYATEAAKKCKEVAFNKKWSEHLISIIHVANIPSQQVAQKIGMKLHRTTIYKQHKVHIYSVNN